MFWLGRGRTCSKDSMGVLDLLPCLGHPVTFLQEPGWMGQRYPRGLTSLPVWTQPAITLSLSLEAFPLLSQKSWLQAAERLNDQNVMGPHSSLGQVHTKDCCRAPQPLQTPAHTAVYGKAIPSWRRIYKYKILINHKPFNLSLSGKESNIRLLNKPPAFF